MQILGTTKAAEAIAARGEGRGKTERKPSFKTTLIFWSFVGPLILGLTVFFYAPLIWSFILSFSSARATITPTQFVGLQNYSEMLSDPDVPFMDGMINSAIVAVLQTVGQILICALAGYGLARIPYRWANQVFYAILVTLMIPFAVIFVPVYVIVSYLGWINTLQGLVVPGVFSGFTTFLFRQFFLSFPRELEEAARIDGLGYWGTFWRIVVPNSYGIIAALSVITFITSWNAFLWPLVVGQDPSAYTVQVVLSNFLNAQVLNLHELFIGATIGILPLVIIFFFLQRYIVEGYKQSGIKG